MTTQANSRSPTREEVLRTAIEYYVRDLHTALPGRVESYDPATQTADIKPLVQRLEAAANGEEILESLPVIPGVPVALYRGGRGFVSVPLEPGDHVMVVFQERSIDRYISGDGSEANPDDFRTHSLSDAVAYPGLYPKLKAIAADADNVVVGKEGGAEVHVGDAVIELGQKASVDKASLDSKVQTELAKLASDINTLKTIFFAWAPVPGDGGAVLKTAITAATWDTSTISISPTNSALVTIKE